MNEPFFKYNKLKGKIKEVCGTQAEFTKKMQIGHVSMSKKMNNLSDFTSKEIYKACKILQIPKEQVSDYFFTTNVQKHEH